MRLIREGAKLTAPEIHGGQNSLRLTPRQVSWDISNAVHHITQIKETGPTRHYPAPHYHNSQQLPTTAIHANPRQPRRTASDTAGPSMHATLSPSILYPLEHDPVHVSRTARPQTASSHCASSRATLFCTMERKLPLVSSVVALRVHSWPTGTPFRTRPNRFVLSSCVQFDVTGVLIVQLSLRLAATVLKSCVNRFGRSPAGLLAYQVVVAAAIR